MANNKNKVLFRIFGLMATAAITAQASELWQYSNPLFEVLDLSAANSYSAPVALPSSGWQSTLSSAQTTTAQWSASGSGDSWFASSIWSGGASASTGQSTVLADDVFRGYLFTGSSSSNSNMATSSSSGPWFSNFFTSSASTNGASDQGTTAFWQSYSGWDSGSGAVTPSTGGGLGWWNAFNAFDNSGSGVTYAANGAWWGSYGGFAGGGAISSDTAACNMVSSWAGTGGWRSFFDGGAAPAAPTSSCNAQQSSTISSLSATTNLVATNAPIGLSADPVLIGGVDNPEPGTWLMMVGGLSGFAYFRRRKAGKTS